MKSYVGVVLGSLAVAGFVDAGVARADSTPPAISVQIADVPVFEGFQSFVDVPITLSAPAPAGGLCLQITTGGPHDSAVRFTDYRDAMLELQFAAGGTQATARFVILDDAVVEDDKLFQVDAAPINCDGSPGPGAIAVDTSDTGTVTILDNEEMPASGSGSTLTVVGAAALGFGLVAVGSTKVRRRTRPA